MVQEIRDVVIRTRVEFDKGSSQQATRDAVDSARKSAKSASHAMSQGVSDYVTKAVNEEKRLRAEREKNLEAAHKRFVRIAASERKGLRDRRAEEKRDHEQRLREMDEAHRRFVRYRAAERKALAGRRQDDIVEAGRSRFRQIAASERLAAFERQGGKAGAKARRDSRGVNPFSTGIGALDALNAKGFQLFITASSVTVLGSLIKGFLEAPEKFFNPQYGDENPFAALGRDLFAPEQARDPRSGGGFLTQSANKAQAGLRSLFGDRAIQAILDPYGAITGERDYVRDYVNRSAGSFTRRQGVDPFERIQNIQTRFEKPNQVIDELTRLEQILVGLNKQRLDTAKEALNVSEREYQVTKQRYESARASFALLDRSSQQQAIVAARNLAQRGYQATSERDKDLLQRAGLSSVLEKAALADPASQQLFRALAPIVGLEQELRRAAQNQNNAKQALFKIEAELGLPEIRLDIQKNAQALSEQLVPMFKELRVELNKLFQQNIRSLLERQKAGGQGVFG